MDPELFRNSSAGRLVKATGGYWAFVPNALPPAFPWTSNLVTVLSEADRALGNWRDLAGRSLTRTSSSAPLYGARRCYLLV